MIFSISEFGVLDAGDAAKAVSGNQHLDESAVWVSQGSSANMTAIELIQKAQTCGLLLTANWNRLSIEGDVQHVEQLRAELLTHKWTILAILGKPGAVPSETDAVLAAMRLLRRGT